MSINSERIEIDGVVNRLLDDLALCVVSRGMEGSDLRKQIGKMRSRFMAMLSDLTFADELLKCFTLAETANVTMNSLTNVQNGLFAETPVGEITGAIHQMAVVFCMGSESRMAAELEFTSRDDVEAMIRTMKAAFDTARELSADSYSSDAYRNLTFLAGALTNHLASVSRPLPRMVTFSMAKSLPALTLSQRLYYTGERSDELVAENKTIHPAFVQRIVRGLSR